MDTDARSLFVTACCATLVCVGVWHIVDGPKTERVFTRATNVRAVGALLLLASIPCFVWAGWYFLLLGIGLAASGALRLFAAGQNIRLQRNAYPRAVHGWIMLAGGIAVWVLRVVRVDAE